jgi:hypothetical protein
MTTCSNSTNLLVQTSKRPGGRAVKHDGSRNFFGSTQLAFAMCEHSQRGRGRDLLCVSFYRDCWLPPDCPPGVFLPSFYRYCTVARKPRERGWRQLEGWLAHLGGHGRQQQQEHRRRRRLRRCRHHSLLLSSISHPTRALISSRMFRSFRERPYRTASC